MRSRGLDRLCGVRRASCSESWHSIVWSQSFPQSTDRSSGARGGGGATKWVSDLPSRCGPTAGWICQSTALGWLCSMTASMARQCEAASSASPCEWGASQGRVWERGLPRTELRRLQPGPYHPPHPSLRAPKSPDATVDMGRHEFTYALMPHEGECCGPDTSLPLSASVAPTVSGEHSSSPTPLPSFSTTRPFPVCAQGPSKTLALFPLPTASTSPCWRCPPQARHPPPPGAPFQCPRPQSCWRPSNRQGPVGCGERAGVPSWARPRPRPPPPPSVGGDQPPGPQAGPEAVRGPRQPRGLLAAHVAAGSGGRPVSGGAGWEWESCPRGALMVPPVLQL